MQTLFDFDHDIIDTAIDTAIDQQRWAFKIMCACWTIAGDGHFKHIL